MLKWREPGGFKFAGGLIEKHLIAVDAVIAAHGAK